jgi:urease accessory protein
MFLVGLAATLFPDRNRWFVLAAFPAGLLGGFVMSATVPGAVVEAAILVSLIATGLAIAARLKTPVWLAMLAVAGFGYAHGAAHGIEMPDYVMPAAFVAGFLVTSVVVHATGYWLARKLPIKVLQAIGAGGAGLGLVLAGA